MQKDHRPYFIKKAYLGFQNFHARRFLRPQFESLGRGFTFIKPWHVEIFGPNIVMGEYATVIATPDRKVRLCAWPNKAGGGMIEIGDYCLICPGVRISSASEVRVGGNCMLANGVYITDADWHGVYDRISMGATSPVRIKENVWIGDSAIICKGVTIGKNSIIGAGAVVVKDVPPNVVAAGNPAGTVKNLDPDARIATRSQWFSDPARLFRDFDHLDREMLRENTIWGWLRSLLFPARGD